MGSLEINDKTIDKYIRFLKKFNDRSKRKLIAKLSDSLDSKEKKESDINSLFGPWNDSKSSDIIIKEIRESRVEYGKTEGFE